MEAKNSRLQPGVVEKLFEFCEEYLEEMESSESEADVDEGNLETSVNLEIQQTLAENIDDHRGANDNLDF